VTVENKKCRKGSQIGQIEKKVELLEECEKRKAILKAKFSSSITSANKNRAWQEIANIINAGNSVKKVLSLKIRSLLIALLTSSIRYRLT